jgi:hypothetical protein
VKKITPDMPIIMITAYSTAQGQQEATELGVHRYFLKPLDTDQMLTAVHKALYGESIVLTETLVKTGTQFNISSEVRKRLEALRADTGATHLMLATVTGEIVLEVGSGHQLDSPKLAIIIAQNLGNSFLLAKELNSENPFTIQYHTGDTVELYSANIGRDYFVALFFDVQSRRGRIGTIWVFAQRAIKDLLLRLPRLEKEGGKNNPAEVTANTEILPEPMSVLPIPDQLWDAQDRVNSTVVIGSEKGESSDLRQAESAEMAELGLGAFEEVADLDAFWDDVLTQSDSAEGRTAGFSFEEAQRKGLIPNEFDFDEQSD